MQFILTRQLRAVDQVYKLQTISITNFPATYARLQKSYCAKGTDCKFVGRVEAVQQQSSAMIQTSWRAGSPSKMPT